MNVGNGVAIREGATPAPYEHPQVPVIDSDIVRPRLPEVGRIRCGEKETKTTTKGGKQVEVTFPKKLGTFRFTSRERSLIERVAELYGGTVKPWASDEGPQWQVTSEANSIQVIVPTADLAFSQYFELWDGGGCQRRCDGHYEMLGDRQCVCNPADRAAGKEGSCKPTTRLGVFLPGIKGLGVWRLESHGKNAGGEIKGSVMLIAAYGAGLTRATLTTAIRPGRQRKPDGTYTPVRYVVPTLISADDIGQYVDRAQIEAAPVRGVLPSSYDYPAPTDDKMRELFATFREVFPKQERMSAEDYRGWRLDWSAAILNREIPSWNGPEAPETLTRADVQTLLDVLESTASIEHPASEAQTGPLSPKVAGPADSTTPPSSAVEQLGDMAVTGSALPTLSDPVAAPAEHHTAEVLGEVAPADGTVPAGRAGVIPDSSAGAAPTPKRKPRKTDPGKGLSIPAAIAEKQRFMDERKTQTVVEHTGWLAALPPEAVYNLMTFFQNADNPEAVSESVVRVFARRNAIEHGTEWTPEQIDKLALETWRKS
jgi:hypothetical protein